MKKLISVSLIAISFLLYGQNDNIAQLVLNDAKVTYQAEGELELSYIDSVQALYLISFDHNYDIKHKWIYLFYDLWHYVYTLTVTDNSPDLGFEFMCPMKFTESQYIKLKETLRFSIYNSSSIGKMPKMFYNPMNRQIDIDKSICFLCTEMFPVKWVKLTKVEDILVNGRNNTEFSYIISDKNEIITHSISRVIQKD